MVDKRNKAVGQVAQNKKIYGQKGAFEPTKIG
jgi:hypothetical protein